LGITAGSGHLTPLQLNNLLCSNKVLGFYGDTINSFLEEGNVYLAGRSSIVLAKQVPADKKIFDLNHSKFSKLKCV
jgi:hypothetical protein